MISYSQNFEDFMLWRELRNLKNGFYVDVGSEDSAQDLIAKMLHNLCWVGIHIQPNEQDFVADTFRQLGLDWRKHVVSNPKLFRPSDIERSCGNASKSRRKLGFKSKIGFKKIISSLIHLD